ncbi:hypothetical protein G6F24_018403 [Rhizopus arrhizus]|nr:hypothetical protein G6F24_018403 [Rhizopus arrhizus]
MATFKRVAPARAGRTGRPVRAALSPAACAVADRHAVPAAEHASGSRPAAAPSPASARPALQDHRRG